MSTPQPFARVLAIFIVVPERARNVRGSRRGDLYIDPSKFRVQFAADVSTSEAKLMAATQRPITEAALNERAAVAAWKTIPSWFFFGSLDKNIPRAAHAFMAQRAHARKVVEIDGASHVVMISHPEPLVKLIAEAATQTTS